MFRFLPEQASEVAAQVDQIHNLITDLSVFFTVAIVGSMLYFAIRYRKKGGVDHETPQIISSHKLEFLWTFVPTLICIYIAYEGVRVFRLLRVVPANALEIQVRAQKWKWDFEYKNGKKTTGEAVIPVDQTVKFVMQSRDVIHSFYVPAMRVKADVIPERYTYVAFKPIKTGTYQIFCAEYCGRDHSGMMSRLRVVSQAEYDRWVADRSEELEQAKLTPAERGETLYTKKGCNACHSLDGSRLVGPSWMKIYGRQGKFTDGQTYTADDNYIRESILAPAKHIVDSYSNLMPSFDGQISDDEISSIIAFMKTLDGTQKAVPKPAQAAAPVDTSKMTPTERGKLIYETKLCKTCHSIDGSKIVGPSFKGLYGSQQKITGAGSVTADDAYIKESIFQPAAKIVEGFPNAMPPFQGQLNDGDVADVIEFLKTLK